MNIESYFISGDVKGAMEFMRTHAEFAEALPAYINRFEKEQYENYAVSDELNRILLAYQVYFRNVFYCGMTEEEASAKLLDALRNLLDLPGADDDALAKKMTAMFEAEGLHTQFGDTQGHYGPYIWRETVPTVYRVELPDGTAEYTVNILRGFLFRSWMDYLTFGRYGTGGWASQDGTLNCIEMAYDFQGEKFLVNFLKHEAQHAVDMKRYPGISPEELEYRAKLAELCYSTDPNLLSRMIASADENRQNDAHAMASVRLKRNFVAVDSTDLHEIQSHARNLFQLSNAEMNDKYRA